MSDDGVIVSVFVAVLVIFGALMTVGIAESVKQNRVERACLARGFPNGEFRWFGPNYCVKRVNQTDSVAVLP